MFLSDCTITSSTTWATVAPLNPNMISIGVDLGRAPGNSIIFNRCARCILYAVVDKWEYTRFIRIRTSIGMANYIIVICYVLRLIGCLLKCNRLY